MINIADGGNRLFIIVFVSLDQSPQSFCYEDEEHAGDEPIGCIEFGNTLPCEIAVLVDKKVNDKENDQRDIKTAQESLYILRLVKNL
jgi:hypothetical protein